MSRISICFLVLVALISTISAEPPTKDKIIPSQATDLDHSTYIDGNQLLMFVSNAGYLGTDLSGMFGKTDGLYYPYTSTDDILSGLNDRSVLYTSGLWLAGLVNDSIRVGFAEYSTNYTPGPMSGDTALPDQPSFHSYKLHYDSLAGNPNNDYLKWPTDQGAPINSDGTPQMLGEQMVWSVFNCAKEISPSNFTSLPLGVEIQQTVWNEFPSIYDSFQVHTGYELFVSESENISAGFEVTDLDLIPTDSFKITVTDTNHVFTDTFWNLPESTISYIETDSVPFLWHLLNMNTGDTVLFYQLPTRGLQTDLGFKIAVGGSIDLIGINQFAVVANGAGAVDPFESAGAPWQDFPVPTGVDAQGNPTDGQQVGDGKWLLHTGDNGGTDDGGDRGSYAKFIERSLRYDNFYRLGKNHYDIRFTGSNDNPGIGGSTAIRYYQDNLPIWVPFEIWRSPRETINDPSDDVRLTVLVIDINEDSVFDMSCWGNSTLGGGDYEHSVSGGSNDPYTDWFYVIEPSDLSPGETGYLADEVAMQGGTFNPNEEIMARMVFVNWNGGEQPPFTQEMPEQGTVFRISVGKDFEVDSLTFKFQPTGESTHIYEPLDDFAVYVRYLLYNKSNNYIDSMYLALWSDPDLGGAGDDMVGCDTLDNIGYCYNATNTDGAYESIPPALGFKIIHGPLVPSPGETGNFNGTEVPDYKNLPMTTFFRYIGGEDPHTALELFTYLSGRSFIYGDPFITNPITGDTTTFMHPGDPVTGTGWLDQDPADRRMSISCGPFDMAPGDSQYVLIKIAVGHDKDYLSSITAMRKILNQPYQIPTDINDGNPPPLPNSFALNQNYPNPFNPSTTISFDLPSKSEVSLEIFNILGQKVRTLMSEQLPAGTHVIKWDGTNEIGERVSSGIYLYKLVTDKNKASKKMLLLK